MKAIEVLFWIFSGIIFYTYLGYGIILFLMVILKRTFLSTKKVINKEWTPEVTLLVTAYNEKDTVQEKIINSRALNYSNLKLVWVTDGSDDGTDHLLSNYDDVIVLHKPERKGKIAAMNRAMEYITSPIVVFSDANTILATNSIQLIVDQFKNPKVGCVSGEKRIINHTKDDAASAGEGIYWKYESLLKKWDAELNTAVGAAGELFAIRKELFNPIEEDTLLDDFIISLRIAMKGYKIGYNPEAYAIETASISVKEELKRKIRISAGGIQSVLRLASILNIFKYGLLSFQYISHRVLRWTLAPLSLIFVFILNIFLIRFNNIYNILFYAQIIFYVIASIGWMMERAKLRLKIVFIPYYFFIMNYAVVRGFFRFIRKTQSVNWERAIRS